MKKIVKTLEWLLVQRLVIPAGTDNASKAILRFRWEKAPCGFEQTPKPQ